MFENYSIWQIIHMGGFTMYILIGCSVVTVGIIVERIATFLRLKPEGSAALRGVKGCVERDDLRAAQELCRGKEDVISRVLLAGLEEWGQDERIVSAAMERVIGEQTVRLERHTGILGTIGSVAVYIGLFGTVLGIMRAMHDIGTVSIGGGINVAITGVAEALICTAAGLIVAVSAVVAYNYFVRRISVIVAEMQSAASELQALALAAKGWR
jgi:biopolymer transport protein ExbB